MAVRWLTTETQDISKRKKSDRFLGPQTSEDDYAER